MRKHIFVWMLLVLPLKVFSGEKPKFDPNKPYSILLQLKPSKCIITGEENNNVVSMDGDKVALSCELGGSKITCNQAGKEAETYDVVMEEGVFFSRSQGGHIYILGNLKTKRYSISSNHIIPEKGMLMTKHCTGLIDDEPIKPWEKYKKR